MFPRSYFGGHYFAPRFWPQSQGTPAVIAVPPIHDDDVNIVFTHNDAPNVIFTHNDASLVE